MAHGRPTRQRRKQNRRAADVNPPAFDQPIANGLTPIARHKTRAKKQRNRSQAGVWLIFRRVLACFVLDVVAEKCA